MSLRILPVMAALTLGLTASVHAADDIKDPTGTWMWEYDYGQGPIASTLVLKHAEGKVTGYYDNGSTKTDIKDGTFEDKKFFVEFPLEHDGLALQVKLDGEVTNDKLKGQISVDVGGEVLEFEWKAERGLLASDVIGTWELKINSPDGQVFSPKVTIEEKEGKLTGVYDSVEVGKYDLSEVELEDGKLEFEVTLDFDGNKLELEFEGHARGEQLAGELEYDLGGQTGEADFTGKRVKTKENGESQQ